MQSEWQPIETAPEGVEVLAFIPESEYYSYIGLSHKKSDPEAEITTAIFNGRGWSYSKAGHAYERDDYFGDVVLPSHWMPLPLPPKDPTDAE